jgi:hypothetical protein
VASRQIEPRTQPKDAARKRKRGKNARGKNAYEMNPTKSREKGGKDEERGREES